MPPRGSLSSPAHNLRSPFTELPPSCPPHCCRPAWPQELEFIIYPDGRVEERVLGVKGADCQKLTLKIEQELGEVYHTEVAEHGQSALLLTAAPAGHPPLQRPARLLRATL